MSVDAPARAAASDRDAAPDPAAPLTAVGGVLQSLLHDLWTLLQDHAALTILEVQRAMRTVTSMLFAGVVVAVLIVTAWLAVVASVIFWVVADDRVLAIALLVAAVVHGALSVAIIWWIRRLARERMFSALLRQFQSHEAGHGS